MTTPLAHTKTDAARALGVCPATVHRMVRRGQPPRRVTPDEIKAEARARGFCRNAANEDYQRPGGRAQR